MREYKFRGKTNEMNSWWTYGNLVICDNGDYQIGHCPRYGDVYYRNEVIPETVGQYTGLKDKKGEEIYEGDIIQYEDISKGVVEYSEKYAQFILKETGVVADECEALGEFNIKVFEIIGNVWENKEIMEE